MSVECVTITDPSRGTTAKILVGFGFNCFSFQVTPDSESLEVLWSAADFESGTERPSGSGIPILFPFPGRIQGAKFTWDGKLYQLEEGDGLGNAIHGFVHERPWRVIEKSESRVVGQFQASVDDTKLLERWPADFCITASYEVESTTLKSTFTIENPDERPLPLGIGTHPYFRIPILGTSADDCIIKLPVGEMWELKGMNTTGNRKPVDDAEAFQHGLRFADTSFDTVFGGLKSDYGSCSTSIDDPDSGRRLIMTFDDTFKACVVYNPQHRQAICIEPYTCVPDPIRLTELGCDAGLRILDPGKTLEASIEMRVE